MENYDLVQKGFRVLHPVMAAYVVREIIRLNRQGWREEVENVLYDQELPYFRTYEELVDSLDLANCFRLIDRKWNDTFYEALGRNLNCRTWAKELMGVRNTVAHHGASYMDQMDAERALDTMCRLCEAFDTESAKEIREIYNTLRYGEKNGANNQTDLTITGPVDVEVPYEKRVSNHSDNVNLMDLIGTDVVQKTNLTRKVTFAGKTLAYPVYRVRLDYLYYNDQNDRITTWLAKYRAESGMVSLDQLSQDDYNNIIESFIFDSNPESIVRTQKNIAMIGQREPGVTLSDGRIVDGNRRFTCLRRIQRESKDPVYFETVILDLDIQKDKKQIKILELTIQHGEEKRVDYDLIDYTIGTYLDIVKEKNLTIEEYARSTNETPAEVRKRLDIAEIICEFLEYIKLPEHYHVAREMQVYSLFLEMLAPMRALPTEEEKNQLKTFVFNNAVMKAFADQRRFIREIKNLIKNKTYANYFEDQSETNQKFHELFDNFPIRSKKDIDTFVQNNKDLAVQMERSMERAMLRTRNKQTMQKPGENIQRSIELIGEIDTRLIDRMNTTEKKNLEKGFDDLSELIGNFKGLLDDRPKQDPEKNKIVIEELLSADRIDTFKLAMMDINKPFVACTTAGKPITRFFVTMKFIGISYLDNMVGPINCKAYFVDAGGAPISEIKPFKVESGKETSVFFSMHSDSMYKDKCRLVIQEANSAADEALQLIPFDLDITSNLK